METLSAPLLPLAAAPLSVQWQAEAPATSIPRTPIPPGSPQPRPQAAPRPRGTPSAPRPRSAFLWDTQREDSRALGHDGRRDLLCHLHTSRDPPQASLRATGYPAKRGGKMPAQPIRTPRGWALGRAQPLQWWRDLSQEGVAWDLVGPGFGGRGMDDLPPGGRGLVV